MSTETFCPQNVESEHWSWHRYANNITFSEGLRVCGWPLGRGQGGTIKGQSQVKHCIHKELSKPGTVAHACNPGTWDVDTGGSRLQDHPLLHRKFGASLCYPRLCLKRKEEGREGGGKEGKTMTEQKRKEKKGERERAKHVGLNL